MWWWMIHCKCWCRLFDFYNFIPTSIITFFYHLHLKEHRGLLSIKYPMEHGIVKDWNDMEQIWQYIYSKDQLQTISEEVSKESWMCVSVSFMFDLHMSCNICYQKLCIRVFNSTRWDTTIKLWEGGGELMYPLHPPS